jgi:hypothetical protein
MRQGSSGDARRPADWAARPGRTRWFPVLIVFSLVAATPILAAFAIDPRENPREAPPPPFNWLDRVNAVRAAADLPALAEDTDLSAGSKLHSRYMVKNNYLGHDEEEENPWYTEEGREAAENGIAYANDGYDASEQRGIDALLTTPFHLLGVLDPRLVKTGFGWYREKKDQFQAGVTLDISRGLSPYVADATYPIMFPGDGKTMPFSQYYGTERPDPLTSCPGGDFLGAPIVVQLASTPEDVSVKLVKDGAVLERCVFDETSYVHPDPETQEDGRAILEARHAVVIMSRKPLSTGRYDVALTSGGVIHAWSFQGPTSAAPPGSTVARSGSSQSQVAPPERSDQPGPVGDCSPRPGVGIGFRHLDDDLLQVNVVARGEGNTLRALRFGTTARPFKNAAVSLPGYPTPITGELSLTLPPGAPQRTFVVRRVKRERSMLAAITVTDNCGNWSVVVSADDGDDLTGWSMPADD